MLWGVLLSYKKIDLSVIIPCYNESASITKLISRIKSNLPNKFSFEIIFVNNGSTDESTSLFHQFRLEENHCFKFLDIEENIGYGNGIIYGMNSAMGDVIAWTHADLQTDPVDIFEAYEVFINHPNFPTCILKGKRINRNLFDTFFTRCMSIISSILLKKRLSDINAQPKMFHRSFLGNLPNPPKDFSLDLYLLYQTRLNNLKVIEFPVSFEKRLYGKSKGGGTLTGKFRLIVRTFRYILKLRKDVGI